jgi:hypothetical protein
VHDEEEFFLEVCLSHGSKKSFDVFSKLLVPQTDSGEWDEHSKAIGLIMVKELGNLTP